MEGTQTTQEEIKGVLKQYSKFLRRDFLAILVKMSAKQLSIKTVRSDWRTRKGMLSFLQNHWPRILTLLNSDTIFKWYCQSFDTLEKIFSRRKFIMHIFSNWNQHKDLLNSGSAISFLRSHQTEIDTIIGTESTRRSRNWVENELGAVFDGIIEQYFSSIHGKNNLVCPNLFNEITVKPLDTSNPVTPEDEMSFVLPIADSLDTISIDDVGDPFPLEIAFEQMPFPTRIIEDPFLIEEYHL